MSTDDHIAGGDHILLMLGRGSFSSVECVVRKGTREIAARKVYERARSIETGRAQRIMQEKQALMALKSPFICKLLGTEKDESNLYMYLEPVLGGTLSEYLRSYGSIANMHDIRVVAVQLMSALRHMRAAGCLHRDIKCNNIVLCPSSRCVKLCDFSSAKLMSGSERTYTLIGTPEFMAPEIVLRCGHSYEVDAWALGVVLFELACGSRPFTDRARDWVHVDGNTALGSAFAESSGASSSSSLERGIQDEAAYKDSDDSYNDIIDDFFRRHCVVDYFDFDVFHITTEGRGLSQFISTCLITPHRSNGRIEIICNKIRDVPFLAPCSHIDWDRLGSTYCDGRGDARTSTELRLSDDVYIDTHTTELVSARSSKYM